MIVVDVLVLVRVKVVVEVVQVEDKLVVLEVMERVLDEVVDDVAVLVVVVSVVLLMVVVVVSSHARSHEGSLYNTLEHFRETVLSRQFSSLEQSTMHCMPLHSLSGLVIESIMASLTTWPNFQFGVSHNSGRAPYMSQESRQRQVATSPPSHREILLAASVKSSSRTSRCNTCERIASHCAGNPATSVRSASLKGKT